MHFSKKLSQINNIKHCFFSKTGGTSKGIYESLNCGLGSKDNPLDIKNNLKIVSNQMGVEVKNLILMSQTHSNKVLIITKENNSGNRLNSDAMITQTKGLAIGVLTADCVPIILYDKKNNSVGCIHAGWKGALSEIIKKTVNKIKRLNSSHKIYASIGPCIDKKNYEIDLNFYKKFLIKSKKNKKYFSHKNKNKKLFNLRKFVADKLIELKVKVDHVNYDTYREKVNFFSYRRSCKLKQNDYGRCISVISLV